MLASRYYTPATRSRSRTSALRTLVRIEDLILCSQKEEGCTSHPEPSYISGTLVGKYNRRHTSSKCQTGSITHTLSLLACFDTHTHTTTPSTKEALFIDKQHSRNRQVLDWINRQSSNFNLPIVMSHAYGHSLSLTPWLLCNPHDRRSRRRPT